MWDMCLCRGAQLCRLTSAQARQIWLHSNSRDMDKIVAEMAPDPIIALDLIAEGVCLRLTRTHQSARSKTAFTKAFGSASMYILSSVVLPACKFSEATCSQASSGCRKVMRSRVAGNAT